ncbi:MAG TPA: glycerophosphodiester phosphodiesterase [Candidatus Dormibacteraeota bacterium]|nr:glycerophosphodiester phosphodiesterase [Candidatus Dormibacteraeota bacterium]
MATGDSKISQMRFIAHGGLGRLRPGGAPDRACLDRCLQAGVAMIELDVCRCADGSLVARHDLVLPSGVAVAALTVAQLRADDRDLLTLDDAADHVAGRVPLLLDLKGAGLAAPLGGWLARRGEADDFAVCTDDATALGTLRALAPRVSRWRTLPEVAEGPGEARRRMAAAVRRRRLVPRLGALAVEVAAAGLCVDHWAVTQGLCAEARRLGLPVAAWTVNGPRRARRMGRKGVNLITTDEPAALREALLR